MILRGDDGFTLVETLVAFIIIVVMATMLYRGLTSGLRVDATVRVAEEALAVAKAKLAAVGAETRLEPRVQQGVDGSIAWEVDIRPYVAPGEADRAAGLKAFWAKVKVTWRDRRSATPQSLELTTLKLETAQ